MLWVYDDAARDAKAELKMMNFRTSYALPEGKRIDHLSHWDGTAACDEDGYLLGVQSLIRATRLIGRSAASGEPVSRTGQAVDTCDASGWNVTVDGCEESSSGVWMYSILFGWGANSCRQAKRYSEFRGEKGCCNKQHGRLTCLLRVPH
jgi:hypothetical protein